MIIIFTLIFKIKDKKGFVIAQVLIDLKVRNILEAKVLEDQINLLMLLADFQIAHFTKMPL
jgi:hypothetical protein